ncbi:MAG: radical SAM protein [candidate division KSB1 bacterium]|nr:radical SAM protein [candidate division KSB1 bacterium]
MSEYVDKVYNIPFDKKAVTLRHLDIELTERCNNNCVHCYINKPVSHQCDEMSTDFIRELIQQAADKGCLSIRFTGGEPLLRPDFAELYTVARQLGIRVILFTNATLLHTDIITLFTDIPPLYPIEVTLYGMHQSSYEAVSRKPNTFRPAWEGIQALWKNNIPFVVKQAFLPPNYNERLEFEAWAETIPCMNQKPDYALNFDLRVRRDSETRNHEIRNVRMSPEHFVEIMARNPKRYLNEMQQFMKKFSKPPGNKLFTCGAGCSAWTVDSFGNLQVCLMVRHPNLIVNLHELPLDEAMQILTRRKESLYSRNIEYRERCAQCFLYDRCRQCPGTAWCEHGVMDQPVDYYCALAHAEAQACGLLTAGEKAWEVRNRENRIRKLQTRERLVHEKSS